MNDKVSHSMPPDLAAALVKAQKLANPVGKDAVHKHHQYKYVAADTMIAEGRAALGLADLSLMSSGWRFDPAGNDGNAIGRVVVSYLLVHSSGGVHAFESSSFVIVEKGRPADKAEMGAITENLSYTIRGLLLLPRVDEAVAVERRDDGNYEPGQRQAAANDAEGFDTAHVALAAELKKRVADLPELLAFRDFVAGVMAEKLPKPLLDDVLAEVVAAGVRFEVDQEGLDLWIPKIKAWELGRDASDRAKAAWLKRSDDIAAQGGAAA